tara:strand:- start:38 stop:409 length:372 start_codon:yes stop_codon:yes gene_type:complete
MERRNLKKTKDPELNERQLNQIGLIIEACDGCEHLPNLGGLRNKKSGDDFIAIQSQDSYGYITIMFGPEEITVAVDGNSPNRGRYRVDADYECRFIGSLINCIWKDDYENLISDFLESDPSKN